MDPYHHNDNWIALGNLKRVRLLGRTWYLSPDWAMWFMPTSITVGLAYGAFSVAGHIASALETAVFVVLLTTALVASFLVTCTDPGVYPRFNEGDVDPNAHDMSMTKCRECNMRRPPRVSHCYTCNVCVLEHDHHCGVVGGCVGQRSLRWFTLYLVCVSSCCVMAFFMILRSLIGQNLHGASMMKGSKHAQFVAAHSIGAVAHIMLIMFIGCIGLMVGGLGGYYVFLLFSDTTRREAQGKMQRRGGAVVASSGCFSNFRRAVNPPPSLLEMDHLTTDHVV